MGHETGTYEPLPCKSAGLYGKDNRAKPDGPAQTQVPAKEVASDRKGEY